MNKMIPTTDMSGMHVGVRYIVTHGSKHKEFQRGDRIRLRSDGSIDNLDACGWMSAEEVLEATQGMTASVDTEWLNRQCEMLSSQITAYDLALEVCS